MQKLIDLCKVNNIKLVMCFSPYYNSKPTKGIELIKDMASKNGISFLDYGLDERFQNPEYFQDASHLNDSGARTYTEEILKQIK